MCQTKMQHMNQKAKLPDRHLPTDLLPVLLSITVSTMLVYLTYCICWERKSSVHPQTQDNVVGDVFVMDFAHVLEGSR
jgi:hypothetical protein